MAQFSTPFRCFDGSAKPFEPFWKFSNAADGSAELELFGPISEYSWMGDEVTPQKFREDLYTHGKGGPVTVKINSPGGDVIAASVMRSIISEYPGEVTTRIDGIAASAAVIVALAGKTVKIYDSAYMMIHDPAVVVMMAALNIETLGKLRDDLKSIKDGIVSAYAARTELSEDKISRLMQDETWMSAREAVDLGFADEVIAGGQRKPQNSNAHGFVNALLNYANVPDGVLALFEESTAEDAPEAQDEKQTAAGIDPIKVSRLRNYLKVYGPTQKGA